MSWKSIFAVTISSAVSTHTSTLISPPHPLPIFKRRKRTGGKDGEPRTKILHTAWPQSGRKTKKIKYTEIKTDREKETHQQKETDTKCERDNREEREREREHWLWLRKEKDIDSQREGGDDRWRDTAEKEVKISNQITGQFVITLLALHPMLGSWAPLH